ncbi:mucin-2 [Patella vulgata]|uniref:mucin-2 n=1 Tax=Patella vulgata TaxID=6465 RepID=UPI0024A878F0|nr:mucin-2 [Patella vulgata]XP_050407776.2 mucin-2 [Patella vulgata]
MSDTSDDSVDSVIAVHDPRRLKAAFPVASASPPVHTSKKAQTQSESKLSLVPIETVTPEKPQAKSQDTKTSTDKRTKPKETTATGTAQNKNDHNVKPTALSETHIKNKSDNKDKEKGSKTQESSQKESSPNQTGKETNESSTETKSVDGNSQAVSDVKRKRKRRKNKRSKENSNQLQSPDPPKPLKNVIESVIDEITQDKQTAPDKERGKEGDNKDKKTTNKKDTQKTKPLKVATGTNTKHVGTEDVTKPITKDPPIKDEATKSDMGNKFSSEKHKGNKDHDCRKKDKESKKKNKGSKSKSPTSDKDLSVDNRSSIETNDSYSSAATLVATAKAAIGKRSPKKSPRAIPRSGVRLRDAISSDDESFASAGFRTPQATTPLLKRAADPTSPSQRLLEFGRNMERDITEKFRNISPSSAHPNKDNAEKSKKGKHDKTGNFDSPSSSKDTKEPTGTSALPDKLFSSLPKRCSKDVNIETDSDSFGMFENTERLYASLPKDYYPIDDNLSDDVFMSCIDLAANSPDIPLRSQNSPSRTAAQMHSSPATSRKDLKPYQQKSPKPPHKQSTSPFPTHKTTVQQPSSISPITSNYSPEDAPKNPTNQRRSPKSPGTSKRLLNECSESSKLQRHTPMECSKSPKSPRHKNSDKVITPNNPINGNATKSPGTTRRQALEASKSPTSSASPAAQLSPKSPNRSRRVPTRDDSKCLTTQGLTSPDVIPKKSPTTDPKSQKETRRVKESKQKSAEVIYSKIDKTSKAEKSNAIEKETKTGNNVGVSDISTCAKAVEENTQIQDSPKPSKQEKIQADVEKKEHLKSTYDNVPDSDDSMVYFTSKNDPVFFEDNCVSEEIIATEKTPMHYKVEEPRKFGIEILKPPEQGKIECVLLEREPNNPSPIIQQNTSEQIGVNEKHGNVPEKDPVAKIISSTDKSTGQTTFTTKQSAKSQNPPKQFTKNPDIVPASSKSQNQECKISRNLDLVEALPVSPNQNPVQAPPNPSMVQPTQKTQNPDLIQASQSLQNLDLVQSSLKVQSPNLGQLATGSTEYEQASNQGTITEPGQQLTKRQIRRRNKKKKLGNQGSLDSGSEVPLSPTLIPTTDSLSATVQETKETPNIEMGNIEKVVEHTETKISVDKKNVDARLSLPEKDNQPLKEGRGETIPKSDKKNLQNKDKCAVESCMQTNVFGTEDNASELPPVLVEKKVRINSDKDKTTHVPPPSPMARDNLMEITEEDEEKEEAECKLSNEKDNDVLVFGESVLKRLSSLVESQGDNNELERRFQHDFDEDEDEEICGKQTCLSVLDEICDMGEKFKKENASNQNVEKDIPLKETVNGNEADVLPACANLISEGIPKSKTQSPVQKRPSIPCELQLKDCENPKTDSLPSTQNSLENQNSEPKRDSQQITEVINSYSDVITPTNLSNLENLPKPDTSNVMLNPTGLVLKELRSSSDEEFHSPLRRFSGDELRIPAIEETFSELMSVKNILQDMEDKTPTAEVLPKFIGPEGIASPPSYLIGSGRRSRMSPAITERTESELDMSEQLDNVSIGTDSMYADDEDDGCELIFNKTYTEDKGAECLVSCTFYNTSHDYDSDEFWADSSAAEDHYKVVESSANEASCTFYKARSEMHDIQRHLQDLRRQMEHLQEDVQTTTLTPTYSMGSSEWRPITE